MVLQISYVMSYRSFGRAVPEIGAIQPHFVQNDGQFARHRNHGATMTFGFCQSHPPGFSDDHSAERTTREWAAT